MYTTLIQNAKEKLKYKYLLKEGFVDKNYEPQRCFYCNSTLLEDCNADRTDYIVLSYDVKCKNCDKVLGHWSCGNWKLY